MIRLLLLSFFLLLSSLIFGQFDYDLSTAAPYGKPNPKASAALKDWAPLIGTCDCVSTSRKQDGSWAEPVAMIWRFKYIMNGLAVQDETLKADGAHSGSIRLYDSELEKWLVHYYSSSTLSKPLSFWEGGLKEDKIVLYKDQAAPNGSEGFYRLTFYEISKTGYKWVGEWVDKSETVIFPTWKIDCKKRKE